MSARVLHGSRKLQTCIRPGEHVLAYGRPPELHEMEAQDRGDDEIGENVEGVCQIDNPLRAGRRISYAKADNAPMITHPLVRDCLERLRYQPEKD